MCCWCLAGSSAHLAVLTSDQSWQLYNVADLSMPEQRFKLQWQSTRYDTTPLGAMSAK
jgi:hypothetical protein